MKFARLLIVVSLLLTACAGNTEPEDFELAKRQCAELGVKGVARYERGKHIVIFCANGLVIEVRKHNVKD